MQAGHYNGPACNAYRGCIVVSEKYHSFFRQLVHIGRLHIRIIEIHLCIIGLVVGKEKDDIRTVIIWFLLTGQVDGRQCNEQKGNKRFHRFNFSMCNCSCMNQLIVLKLLLNPSTNHIQFQANIRTCLRIITTDQGFIHVIWGQFSFT